ncbi:MAG: HEAT repeat domain-containing protein [Patescibacteria group bacterium]
MKEKKIEDVKEKLFYLISVGISIFLLFFFILNIWIGYEVKDLCQNAKKQYGGGCVEALMVQLNDEKQDFRTRNDSIWALGQLGDRRALPVLKRYYTGNIPDREPLDKTISQYELKKAVNLAGGGLNITAWAWRWGIK